MDLILNVNWKLNLLKSYVTLEFNKVCMTYDQQK